MMLESPPKPCNATIKGAGLSRFTLDETKTV